ncbi:unnamed protein product, partial [Mesorhabditis spiculigera]
MAALGFMDVFSLCLSAHLSGIFYILGAEYCMYPRIHNFVMHLGQASWHLMHGIPSLVYLFLNKTIHRRVFGKYSVFHYRASSGIKPLSTVQKEGPSKGHSQARGTMSEVRLGF